MMPFQVVVTRAAEVDLDDAVDYLLVRADGPGSARKLVEEFAGILERLGEMPRMYPIVRDEMLASLGYRWAPLSTYMVFYTLDDDARIVTIERVLSGRQSWRSIVV